MWYPRPKYTGTNFNADIFIIVAQLIFLNPLQLYHQYSMVFLIGYFHYIILEMKVLTLFFSCLQLIRYVSKNFCYRKAKE